MLSTSRSKELMSYSSGLFEKVVYRVPPVQHELHRLFRAIDQQPSLAREIDRRLARTCGVGEEDVAPAAGGLDVAHEQDAVRKLAEEDARLDIAFGLGRDDVERNLPERLVGVRQRDDHDVGGGGARRHGQHDDRTQHPEQADAAGLQDDELAVGRQPAQADQDAEQQRHRDRDPQRLGHERQQDATDGEPGDTLGDQLLRVARSIGGIISTNVSRSSQRKKGSRISRTRYRSRIVKSQLSSLELEQRSSLSLTSPVVATFSFRPQGSTCQVFSPQTRRELRLAS